MSELAKLKQLQGVSVSSSSPAVAVATGCTGTGGSEQSSGSQMMMMQQMVNSGVDPFLAAGAAPTNIESHAAQRSTDSGLGQYTHCTL